MDSLPVPGLSRQRQLFLLLGDAWAQFSFPSCSAFLKFYLLLQFFFAIAIIAWSCAS